MPIVHANTIGNMVGEQPKRKLAPSERATCPECGGSMHHAAQMCHGCRKAAGRPDLETPKSAQRIANWVRFRAALFTGAWTLKELYDLPAHLPTWEQIHDRQVCRLIREWWEATE